MSNKQETLKETMESLLIVVVSLIGAVCIYPQLTVVSLTMSDFLLYGVGLAASGALAVVHIIKMVWINL